MLEPFKNKEDWDWVKERLVEVNGIDPATIPPGLMDSTNYHFDGRIKPSEVTMPIQAVECYRHLCALHYTKTPENIMNPIAIEGNWRIGQNGPKINYFPYMEDQLWVEEDNYDSDFESDEDLEQGMNQLHLAGDEFWGEDGDLMWESDEEDMALENDEMILLIQDNEVPMPMLVEENRELLVPKVEVVSPVWAPSGNDEIQDWDNFPSLEIPFNIDDYLVYSHGSPQYTPAANPEESGGSNDLGEDSDTEDVSMTLVSTEEKELSTGSSQGSFSGGVVPPKKRKFE
ncbi:hypothetical protein M5689_018982 [Euphorbia peplus]|nr:hypothetical protein M5689_018982 [Euphorbia peplus]